MLLRDWLKQNNIQRNEFGRQIGVTPAAMTGYCKLDFAPKNRILVKIQELTGGAVGARDFLKDEERESA